VDGYFVFTRDLTALKRSERQLDALHRREVLNAAVTASALDCVIVIDEAGRVVEFNPTAERTFGYTRRAALGRPIAELIVPPALRARHTEGFRRYLATGESAMIGRLVELEGMRADGSLFPVELAVTEGGWPIVASSPPISANSPRAALPPLSSSASGRCCSRARSSPPSGRCWSAWRTS
jgi:PAS domain S-box-containing protein